MQQQIPGEPKEEELEKDEFRSKFKEAKKMMVSAAQMEEVNVVKLMSAKSKKSTKDIVKFEDSPRTIN